MRQPVGWSPQSGSTSMATKPYWVKRIRSTPPLRPLMMMRCAAAVPALISPATIVMSCFAAATPPSEVQSSISKPAMSARTLSGGWYSPNRWFLPPFGIELRQRLAEPHLLHHHVRRRAAGQVAEFLDLDEVDASLYRQQGERKGLGDESRVAPTRPDGRAAPLAGLLHASTIHVAHPHATSEQIADGGDDVRPGRQQRHQVLDQLVFGEAGPGLPPAGGTRHVDAAVGIDLQHGVTIGRGQDAGRSLAAELARIDAVLRRRRRPAPRRDRAAGCGSPPAAPAGPCFRSPTASPERAKSSHAHLPARAAEASRSTSLRQLGPRCRAESRFSR